MQKALMALSWRSKSLIVKAGNQFNGYLYDFTHNKKIQNKNIFFILQVSYFISKVKEFSCNMVKHELKFKA